MSPIAPPIGHDCSLACIGAPARALPPSTSKSIRDVSRILITINYSRENVESLSTLQFGQSFSRQVLPLKASMRFNYDRCQRARGGPHRPITIDGPQKKPPQQYLRGHAQHSILPLLVIVSFISTVVISPHNPSQASSPASTVSFLLLISSPGLPALG